MPPILTARCRLPTARQSAASPTGRLAARTSSLGLVTVTEAAPAAAEERRSGWTFQWKELYDEVITSGLCTGCAGCVIACPHDVIGYDHEAGRLQAVPPRGRARARRLHPRREGLHHLHPGLPPLPARGSPRPTSTSSAATASPTRSPASTSDILLTRASDDMVHQMGQDGGLVSAILIWAMDAGLHRRRAHLVPRGRRPTRRWKAIPGVAANTEEILAGAGQPLHVLGQHARHRRGARSGASRSWRSSA